MNHSYQQGPLGNTGSKRSTIVAARVLALVWFSFITYLFLLPGKKLPQWGWTKWVAFDKWVHAGFFAIATGLFIVGFSAIQKNNRHIYLLVSILVYGVAIEFIQLYCIENRSFSWVDIVFDWLGAYLGFTWSYQCLEKKKNFNKCESVRSSK